MSMTLPLTLLRRPSDEATSTAPILSVRSQNQSCYGERDENGEIR